MKFLEKDLEDIIFSADRQMLANRGLEIEGKLLRQVKLGNYGICDLLSIITPSYNENFFDSGTGNHGSFYVTVYELKKDQISMSSFLQCVRYGKAIESYFNQRGHECIIDFVLIGKYIDQNTDFIFLSDFMNNLEVYTYEYELNGISFKNHKKYSLWDEGFKIKIKK